MGILGSGSIHMESRYARKPVSGRGASAATTVCQKCLQVGHWTYECKNAPAYQARPTRTKQLTDPKYRPRFLGAGELLPESRGAEAGAKDAKQKEKDKKKKKKRKGAEQSSSSSDSDSSSSSGSDSDSGSSSSSDSDSSSSSGSSSSDDSSGSSSSDSDSSSSDSSGSSSSDSDESSSGSDSSGSSLSGSPTPRAKPKGGPAAKDKAERKPLADQIAEPKKGGGKAKVQGQPDQARRAAPGSNGAEANRSRKRHERDGHDDRPGREKEGVQGYADDDRNGSTAPHAAMPPRKKALRSVVVAAQ